MSNFTETFKQGKLGRNMGLPTGIPPLDIAINGIQKKTSIGLAAAQKVGKTTLADFAFVLSPYLHMEKIGELDNINWIYYSFEIDRVSKEFKYASYFMYHDFGVAGYSYKDMPFIPLDMEYLMGKKLYKNKNNTIEQIPISKEHEEMLREVYLKRIVPLFGEYDIHGRKIRNGKIDFIEEIENPTGIYKYIWNYAAKNGTFLAEDYQTTDDVGKLVNRKRIYGYTEKNPELYTVIVTDHIRKPKLERGFNMKQNIDKLLEYHTILRNLCKFTFVDISHMNRGIANVERLKFFGENIFPTADDVKDSGNLAEESTILLTMFNPNDEKYNLNKHMGVDLTNPMNSNYRSIHLVDSRYTECPQHIQARMIGGINLFTSLNAHLT